MKTKMIAIGAAALLSGGVALHMGHEPKCLIKLGLIKKPAEKKTAKALPLKSSEAVAVASAK